jgi:hypothetical protein
LKKGTSKNEGPSCACGKVDLYEEMLKNEQTKGEASEAPPSEHSAVSSHSADSANKED